MKKLLFVFILFNTVFCFAQSHFSAYYNSESQSNDQSDNILYLPGEGYIFCSASTNFQLADTFNYAVKFIYIVRTNLSGDTVWTKKYYQPHYGLGSRQMVAISDSSYLLVGRIIDYTAYYNNHELRDIYLMKINSSGDSVWTKRYSLGPGDEVTCQVIRTQDGGYAILGQTCDQDIIDCDYFLLKLDSTGEKKFWKTYTFSLDHFEMPYSLVETPDHGFFLFGSVQRYANVIDAYLVKTDSLGNKEWDKRYGLDGSRWFGISITSCGDKNSYLLCGAYATSASNSGVAYLTKIDSMGTIIFHKEYGGNSSDEFRDIIIEDNGMIAVGTSRSYNNANRDEGWMMKLSSEGDSLWQRTYGHSNISEILDYSSLFYDVIPTEDNGFCILGNAVTNSAAYSLDVWLLKVDSLGCLVEGCSNTVGMEEELNATKTGFKLYPNPTSSSFTLSLSLEEVGADTRLEITDLFGRVLHEEGIPTSEWTKELDVSLWSGGMYFVRIISGSKRVQTEKLMIIK